MLSAGLWQGGLTSGQMPHLGQRRWGNKNHSTYHCRYQQELYLLASLQTRVSGGLWSWEGRQWKLSAGGDRKIEAGLGIFRCWQSYMWLVQGPQATVSLDATKLSAVPLSNSQASLTSKVLELLMTAPRRWEEARSQLLRESWQHLSGRPTVRGTRLSLNLH
jgi:hypothetical protein